jgi:acyl-homoserine lactone synthase
MVDLAVFAEAATFQAMGEFMIHVISAVNRHRYEDVLDQHFRMRHEIFVEERKWEALRKPDGREIDAYDNEDAIYLLALENRRVLGGCRLHPTTKPTMMSEVFPHLAAERGCPVDPHLDQGIERLCLVMETWWLPRFHDIGFVVTPLGLPAQVEDSWIMAATIEVRQESLNVVRDRIGMKNVVHQDGPRLDCIARANLCGRTAAQRKSA